MKTPKLETERLLLRPLTADDADRAFANWTSDPDVARFMRWELHQDVSETREWLLSEEALLESDGVYNWGLVLKMTGELIGSGGLIWVDSRNMYELGYNMMKKYWGQGLTTEAAGAIIGFGKDELMQKRFFGCHAKDNPASGRVLTKLGFRYQKDDVYHSWDQTRSFASREYLLMVE